MGQSNFHILIDKLDEFIRKYYKNLLIRGLIYAAAMVLAFYLVIALLEYYAHFSITVRTALFYTLLIGISFILSVFIVTPLIKLYRLGKIISYRQAAEIIGNHFKNVEDKLINVLQLQERQVYAGNLQALSLIEASVNQKIKQLSPVPFTAAIDLSKNKKHIKYLLLPLGVFLLLLLGAPGILKDSTSRLVHHGMHYEYAPFHFNVENDALKTLQQEDFLLKVKLKGDEIPEHAYIKLGEAEYRLNKIDKFHFQFLFKNVQKNTPFVLTADGYDSKAFELIALPNPILLNFDLDLQYPAYTQKKNEVQRNAGDLNIPEGTKVKWLFKTKNTKYVKMAFKDTAFAVSPTSMNSFAYGASFFKNDRYIVTTANDYLKSKDSVSYAIRVIPDQFPMIHVDEHKDSLSNTLFYFQGKIQDDYGFKDLRFHYQVNNSESGAQKEALSFNAQSVQESFFHVWDLSLLNLKAGDEVEYYFEVWDNDGVHGSKSTRSAKRTFKAPSLQEIAEKTEKNNQEIKENLQESISEAKRIQRELDELNKKLYEKKQLSWEEKKQMQELIKQQKELQKKLENIQQENKKNNLEKSQFKQVDESLLEKQQQLEKLFNELMSEEMKEKFQELEKLMEKIDKDKFQEALEQMKLSNEDIEKELDRNLALFKQLEFEQKLDEAIEKLDQMSKEQEALAEKTEEKSEDAEKLSEEQEKLNDAFDELQKEMEDLQKKNVELEQPNKMEDTQEEQKAIDQKMEESLDQLEKNKEKKASESQKDAAKQMQELSQKMQQMQQQMAQENTAEDMDALRDILENLVTLSFDQEELIDQLKKIERNDPKFVEIAQEQKKLKDDAKMIEDSLLALSKRVIQIESIVNQETGSIKMNMDKAIKALAERNNREAGSRQQFTMTSINNLALLLDEALIQMQKQMQSQMAASGSCDKPGSSGNKPKPSMSQMQKQLNKRLEEMKKMMEQGNQKGPKKGQGQPGGMGGMSQQLAQTAAQQEALRRELQKMANEMNKNGEGGAGELNKLIEKMEQNEVDLVNKQITQETILRQEEILTRLLEHEKAQREREFDNKRKSEEAKNQNFSNPNEFLEYKRLKEKEAELLRTVPPSLKPFYKNKVNEYFSNFEDQ